MEAIGTREICILYMSCLGEGLAYLLPFSEDFHKRYQIKAYLSHQSDKILENVLIPETEFSACSVFIYHNSEWIALFSAETIDAYDAYLAKVPSNAVKIAFPLAQFHPFWPFHTNDPRVTDPSRGLNRFGERRDYPYGDASIMELLKQGLPAEEIINECLKWDVAKKIDLDGMLNWSLGYMERNEKSSVVKITDYVANNFRKRSLFSTVNHVGNALLLYIANQILKLLECRPIDEKILDSLLPLVGFEMPIHPSIGRHFGVTYINEETRYLIDRRHKSTFAEYIRDYVLLA